MKRLEVKTSGRRLVVSSLALALLIVAMVGMSHFGLVFGTQKGRVEKAGSLANSRDYQTGAGMSERGVTPAGNGGATTLPKANRHIVLNDAGPFRDVTDEAVPRVDISGSISGTVTSDGDGEPIEGCLVVIYRADDGTCFREAETDSSGHYRVGGLPAGDYKVKFVPDDDRHLPEFYENRPDKASANVVTVTVPEETGGIDAELELGGGICGTVVGEEPMAPPVVGCYVEVYHAATDTYAGSGFTGYGGTYRIGALESGQYKVCFWPHAIYKPEKYDDKAGIAEADIVTVEAPDDTLGIDAVLTQNISGSICGTVTSDGDGEPIEGCLVVIYRADDGTYFREAETDSSGHYRVGGLPAGDYKVKFIPRDDRHLPEFYENRPDKASANVVTVTVPEETGGIDAELELE